MYQSHCLETDFESISILLVSPHRKDHSDLRHVLHHADWKITGASNLSEAALILQERVLSVILCERDLPDGNWKDLLDRASQQKNPPMVLVIANQDDISLWAEVLSLGGYDVLMKPFEVSEVTPVLRMAWQRWKERTLKRGTQPAACEELAAVSHA